MFELQYDGEGYYIVIEGLHNNRDKSISNEIGISLKKYHGILKKFNAIPTYRNEHYLYNFDDAEKCCEYLNEKYGVLLKLMGV